MHSNELAEGLLLIIGPYFRPKCTISISYVLYINLAPENSHNTISDVAYRIYKPMVIM
jgi:hypothetical protein